MGEMGTLKVPGPCSLPAVAGTLVGNGGALSSHPKLLMPMQNRHSGLVHLRFASGSQREAGNAVGRTE